MILLPLAISFLIAYSLFPVVIRIFKSIDIMDEPDRRKIHKYSTPSMGGIAIFIGMMVALFIVVPLADLAENKFLIAGLILMLFLGLRDDISSLNANYKLAFQSITAFLVLRFTGIGLTGLYGVFGVGEFNQFIALALSVFLLIALTNSFNLIDGIDGLAGSIALLASVMFGIWFVLSGNTFFAILSLTTVGALVAFLIFNWQPSRIFMGDTGSIFLGFILSCLAFQFINDNNLLPVGDPMKFNSFVAIATSLLIIPIYDTTRVFTLRVFAGQSPFVPDKRHIHHVLLRQGFNHSQSTLILIGFNVLLVILTLQFNFLSDTLLLTAQFILTFSFGFYFDRRLVRQVQAEKRSNLQKGEIFISKSA